MKILLIIITAILFRESNRVCKTTITVLNCANKPVQDAKVFIEKCSDHKVVTIKTDADGEASTNICKSDICQIAVTAEVADFETQGVQQKCDGDNSNYKCVFKICSD